MEEERGQALPHMVVVEIKQKMFVKEPFMVLAIIVTRALCFPSLLLPLLCLLYGGVLFFSEVSTDLTGTYQVLP